MQLTVSLFAALLGPAFAAPTQSFSSKIVKTVEHHGQIVDWIVRESQGDIATPPFERPPQSSANLFNKILSTIAPGPEGTVPVLRSSVQLPPKVAPHNGTVGGPSQVKARSDAGIHWYAYGGLSADNHGGGATINVWDAYVESSADFSLMQIGCSRSNVPNGKNRQTAEAGVMHYPQLYNGGPFLFTYFTTDDYTGSGDNVGGYNTDQKGWVQYSSTDYPGMPLTSQSSFGGTQAEVGIEYYLYEGNWWFYFNGNPMGYYPGSVYSAGTTASDSLAALADDVAFWGEVYNSEEAETTTDMGSGKFPSAGANEAAYMRNMFNIDTSDNSQNYVDNGEIVSDSSRYNIATSYNSGTSWGSYLYLGGPGAGGVTGG